MQQVALIVLIATAGLVGSCAPPVISRETRYLLSKPIDCRTAQEEMDILMESRPNELKRTLTAVQTVEPLGAVGAVVNKDVDNRVRVIKGEHGSDIDRRVQQLAQSCNLPAPGRR